MRCAWRPALFSKKVFFSICSIFGWRIDFALQWPFRQRPIDQTKGCVERYYLKHYLRQIFISMKNQVWYDALKKSKITPPNWVFGMVWSMLYPLMALSFALFFFKSNAFLSDPATYTFLMQFFLNLSWSPLFFSYKKVTPAFFLLIAIFFLSLLSAILFHPTAPWASYLLIPYLLWLLMAGYLNFYIMRHNP